MRTELDHPICSATWVEVMDGCLRQVVPGSARVVDGTFYCTVVWELHNSFEVHRRVAVGLSRVRALWDTYEVRS